MLVVNVSYLLVDVTQLHVTFVHFVVIYNLVDLVHPLVVHEHTVVTFCDHFFTTDELVVLRLHPKTH